MNVSEALEARKSIRYFKKQKVPEETPLFSIFDMGAFSQSLMLSAKEHGVDSMEAYEIVKYPEMIRQFMDIPNDESIVMGIALGYADERKINGFRSDREPLQDVLTIRS